MTIYFRHNAIGPEAKKQVVLGEKHPEDIQRMALLLPVQGACAHLSLFRFEHGSEQATDQWSFGSC